MPTNSERHATELTYTRAVLTDSWAEDLTRPEEEDEQQQFNTKRNDEKREVNYFLTESQSQKRIKIF